MSQYQPRSTYIIDLVESEAAADDEARSIPGRSEAVAGDQSWPRLRLDQDFIWYDLGLGSASASIIPRYDLGHGFASASVIS